MYVFLAPEQLFLVRKLSEVLDRVKVRKLGTPGTAAS
jgi:hypothetical protein